MERCHDLSLLTVPSTTAFIPLLIYRSHLNSGFIMLEYIPSDTHTLLPTEVFFMPTKTLASAERMTIFPCISISFARFFRFI